MKHPINQNLSEIGNEVLDLTKEKGFPVAKDAQEFLINRIAVEAKEIQIASNNKENSNRIAEEAIDVVIQCIQLIKVLGLDPANVYREKMDINWKRS